MDFTTKKSVQLNDSALCQAAIQSDEEKIQSLISQRNFFHEEISHIIQLKMIPITSKLCIFYAAIKNNDFALIRIFLNHSMITPHIHSYKNNAIFILAKDQFNFSLFKKQYAPIMKQLAQIPGIANQIAKQYITEFYSRSKCDKQIDVKHLKKLISPLNSIDKSSVLLNAAAHSQLEVITVLLEHYDDEIVRTDKFRALSYAKTKKDPACIAYLSTHIHQNLIILPKKVLSLISLLKEQHGLLLNYNKLSPEFRTVPFIKEKHNPNLKHSLIQSSNGALFALYRHGIIGAGAYGKIKLAQNIQTGQICVVKIERQSNENSLQIPSIEIEILKKCDLFLDYQENKNYLNDEVKGYIFIKYIPGCTLGDLAQILRTFEVKLSILEQCQLFQSFLKSLKKLKKNNVSHNDLHSNNVMINPSTMQATIIDFGKSRIDSKHIISIELLRIDSILCNVISDTELKKILNNLSNLRKKELVLNGLNDAIDTLDGFIQQHSIFGSEYPSPFATLIEKDLAVIAQLEKLNAPLSGSQPLLFSKTALQKKRKRELKEPPKLSFSENELTEEQSSAEEPKTKKPCYPCDPQKK